MEWIGNRTLIVCTCTERTTLHETEFEVNTVSFCIFIDYVCNAVQNIINCVNTYLFRVGIKYFMHSIILMGLQGIWTSYIFN